MTIKNILSSADLSKLRGNIIGKGDLKGQKFLEQQKVLARLALDTESKNFISYFTGDKPLSGSESISIYPPPVLL